MPLPDESGGLDMNRADVLKSDPFSSAALQQPPRLIASSLRSRQCAKLSELRQALCDAGFDSLDEQARALGLGRSTAYVVLRGDYKASGLSAKVIKRMLASPHLPPEARAKLGEYVEERLAGLYGHAEKRRRVFRSRMVEQA